MMKDIHTSFTFPLLHWYDLNGRKNLPWQNPRTPYRVWLSEIMLQQTQVKTVIPYFERFIQHFPDLQCLAKASIDQVLQLWSGLGYYSRARNLHKTAILIQEHHLGQFPDNINDLIKLPGIGHSTAAAIVAQAYNQPAAIFDGNVNRVLSRYFKIGGFSSETKQRLWELATQCMSHDRPADYTQAIMDLGATCCTSKAPQCERCPIKETCKAKIEDSVLNYPTRKPKKSIPEKYQQFLLLQDSFDRIYLEKQPDHGIWGGLWCPLRIESSENPTAHLLNTYQLNIQSPTVIMNIKHTFTHFRLYITALKIRIKNSTLPELPGDWFKQERLASIGLAKPVSDIIQKLYEMS